MTLILPQLPEELQTKILHYFNDIDVSKKKKLFENIHHELLHGWWIDKEEGNEIHIITVYTPEPVIIRHHTKEEIYKQFDEEFQYKPILFYPYPIPNQHAFDDDITYEFIERMPRLLSS